MGDLNHAFPDATHIEMISMADRSVRDRALPDVDADGNLVSGQQEIAAAIFRRAVSQQGQAGTAIRDSQYDTRYSPPAPMAPPVRTRGYAPGDGNAPIPMNTGYMSDTQG